MTKKIEEECRINNLWCGFSVLNTVINAFAKTLMKKHILLKNQAYRRIPENELSNIKEENKITINPAIQSEKIQMVDKVNSFNINISATTGPSEVKLPVLLKN